MSLVDDSNVVAGPSVRALQIGGSVSGSQYVTCGETITAEQGCLMGHGTAMASDGRLVATVSGFIERVNKLISVRPLYSRYNGEVGDVVVGRIVELGDKRWKVDVGSRHHASLLLSSVNLPGGVLRRRTQEDSLNMRAFFKENDVISAEVQKLRHDGLISLHTRNLKYGLLSHGCMVRVQPNLIKRCKQHFQQLGEEIGVEVILGLNGYIWIQEAASQHDQQQTQQTKQGSNMNVDGEDEDGSASFSSIPVTLAGRERVARVRQSILALNRSSLPIFNQTIIDVYMSSVATGMAVKDMLNTEEDIVRITQTAMQRTRTT